GLAQALPLGSGGISDAGTVHVEKHFVFMGEAGQGFDFVRLVYGTRLCGLGDRDHARLDVVLVADAAVSVADGFDRQFAVGSRNGNELAAGELFRRGAFVGVDVGYGGADHGMERVGKSLQAKAIGGGAVEDDEDFGVIAEMPLEFLHRRAGVGVVAVADCVSMIGGGNGF